jgi:hypothetical protein
LQQWNADLEKTELPDSAKANLLGLSLHLRASAQTPVDGALVPCRAGQHLQQ